MRALRFRKAMAILLMAIGIAMFGRGLNFSFQRGLGWQGFIQAAIAGSLVFALGFVRWRYLRNR
jgi:hypothetical protein